KRFTYILDYLRDGLLICENNITLLTEILIEAVYFELFSLIKIIKKRIDLLYADVYNDLSKSLFKNILNIIKKAQKKKIYKSIEVKENNINLEHDELKNSNMKSEKKYKKKKKKKNSKNNSLNVGQNENNNSFKQEQTEHNKIKVNENNNLKVNENNNLKVNENNNLKVNENKNNNIECPSSLLKNFINGNEFVNNSYTCNNKNKDTNDNATISDINHSTKNKKNLNKEDSLIENNKKKKDDNSDFTNDLDLQKTTQKSISFSDTNNIFLYSVKGNENSNDLIIVNGEHSQNHNDFNNNGLSVDLKNIRNIKNNNNYSYTSNNNYLNSNNNNGGYTNTVDDNNMGYKSNSDNYNSINKLKSNILVYSEIDNIEETSYFPVTSNINLGEQIFSTTVEF
ncbi:conserved protein, unknown function, partial [Hepatocystis sp. ex Piliocolobus tephrosceles]